MIDDRILRLRVYRQMSDGNWHTKTALSQYCRITPAKIQWLLDTMVKFTVAEKEGNKYRLK